MNLVALVGCTTDGKRQGSAGAGKDEVAEHLTLMGYIAIALADPMKRFCKEVFDFSDEQLFGPSDRRNEPDRRYPSTYFEAPEGSDAHSFTGYLTPRYALQQLGTEWGRDCYEDVWVDYLLRTAGTLLVGRRGWAYTQRYGLKQLQSGMVNSYRGIVIPDVRYPNELSKLQKAGCKAVRIKRRVELLGEGAEHTSETALNDLPDEVFDYVIDNNGTLEQLHDRVKQLDAVLSGRIRQYDPAQEDIPPFLRK